MIIPQVRKVVNFIADMGKVDIKQGYAVRFRIGV